MGVIENLGIGTGSGNADLSRANNVKSKKRDFRLEFFIDALPNGADMPQNAEEAIAFIKKLPGLVANANSGKGTPICYMMLPLSTFQHYLGPIDTLNHITKSINENAINEVVRMIDEMEHAQRLLNDLHNDFQSFSFCLTDDDVQSVIRFSNIVRSSQTNIRDQLQKSIVDIRYDRVDPSALYEIVSDYERQLASLAYVKSFIDQMAEQLAKIDYVGHLLKQGVHYVGKGQSLESERLKHNGQCCYIFFCSCNNAENLVNNKRYFSTLVEQKALPCFLADIDIHPGLPYDEGVTWGNRICLYNKGSYISADCYAASINSLKNFPDGHSEYLENQAKSFAKCTQNRFSICAKPIKITDVELLCPLSVKNDQHCSTAPHQWFCADCKEALQFDFNGNFHCECGQAPVDSFRFRCSDPKHGLDFVEFESISNFVDQIQPSKEVNILILGSEGVGKSTFINGFANYMSYSTLKEASNRKQIKLAPIKFQIVDLNCQTKTITVGKPKSCSEEVNDPFCSEPKIYTFSAKKKTFNLIDTHGFGDQSPVMDDRQFTSILKLISQFAEIHGICILMKADESPINEGSKRCLNKLLSHLHSSARNNIVFCFTNSRNSFYRPGNTLSHLDKHLTEIKTKRQIEIPTAKNSTYCFDNEAYRLLCCLHAGQIFTEDELRSFEKSWTNAVQETRRFIDRLDELTPHTLSSTLSLNEALTQILSMTQPLIEISELIQNNTTAISSEVERLEKKIFKSFDSQKSIAIPQINYKVEQNYIPHTLCTGVKCIDVQLLSNTTLLKATYRTVCHNFCNCCNNDTPLTKPRHLTNQSKMCAMIDSAHICNKCGCGWDQHIRIAFKKHTKVNAMYEDATAKQILKDSGNSKTKQEIIVKVLNDRISKYREEQMIINQIRAKFSAFLKSQLNLTYDITEEILKFEIDDTNQLVKSSKSIEIQEIGERLNKQLQDYLTMKKLMEGESPIVDSADMLQV